MKAIKIIGLLSLVPLLFSCASKETIHTYWVNSYTTDCTGVGPMECLMVQQGETIVPSAWENFYAPIAGFDYEMGYLYQIKVKEIQLEADAVPADASSIQYSWLETVKKENDSKLRLNDIWALTSLFGKALSDLEALPEKSITMELHLKDKRVMGSDGCNNFNGSIQVVGQNVLKLGPVASTRMMCPNMEVSDRFNKALSKVEAYEIKDMTLYLYCEEGNELMTLKKVD